MYVGVHILENCKSRTKVPSCGSVANRCEAVIRLCTTCYMFIRSLGYVLSLSLKLESYTVVKFINSYYISLSFYRLICTSMLHI